MTTKRITGTYASGYALQSPTTILSITASGYIGGSGVTEPVSGPNAYRVINRGRIVGAASGVDFARRGTVSNFGMIVGSGAEATSAGVYLGGGGLVTNGAASDATATISGYRGVVIDNGAGNVVNLATITGTGGFYNIAAVYLGGGGRITNGGADDTQALIQGNDAVIVRNGSGTLINDGTIAANPNANYVAVDLAAGGLVINAGTVSSGGGAVALLGGRVINGSLVHGGGLIESGGVGVYVGAAGGTVQNFGAIMSGAKVFPTDAGILGEGRVAVTNGAASDTSARIEGYSGVNLQGGGAVVNFGTILATDTYGAGVVLRSGGNVINGAAGDTGARIQGHVGVSLTGAGVLTNFGVISGTGGGDAVVFASAEDKLVVEAGSRFVGGVIGGGGTLDLASGSGTIAGGPGGALKVTVGTAVGVFGGFAVVDIGASAQFALSGSVALAQGSLLNVGASTLMVASGASLSGGGRVDLGTGGGAIVGESPSSRLVIVDDILDGGGRLGDGALVLVNGAGGIINGDSATALIIDTGASRVTNGGLIEATGAGGVTIDGAIANAGTLYASHGNLTVDGIVSGAGVVRINAAAAAFEGAFHQNVGFGAAGSLELAQSQTYAGTISGFSTAGATKLDLDDIAFGASTKASFSGTAGSGVLTVTDGVHTARLELAGNYLGSTFSVSSDGRGGADVVDTSGPTRANPQAFVSAMAALGGGGHAVDAARVFMSAASLWIAPPHSRTVEK